MMMTFLKIKSIFIIIVGLIFAVVFVSEIGAINENAEEYIKIYGISESSPEWKYQSVDNFKKWNVIIGLLVLFYVFLNGLSLITKKLSTKYLVLIIDVLIMMLMIINFCLWSASGFDH